VKSKIKIHGRNGRSIYISLFTVLSVLLSGCGYTLQTRANLPFRTISVGTIENKTSEPKLQDRFYEALATSLSEYGFEMDPSARYRLEGQIYYFELLPTTEINLTATQYQIVIKGNFKLVDTESGKSINLAANSPFVTYFNANPAGRLESIMTQKEIAEESSLTNMSHALVSLVVYNTPKDFTGHK
jgi:hypothetical protein